MEPLLDPLLAAATRVAAGDSDAFRVIVEQTHARLLQLGLRILGDASEAEDVVQEAYVRAHRALVDGEFDRRSSIATWLYRIVTHTAIDAARRGKRIARLWRSAIEAITTQRSDPDSHVELKQLAGWLHRLPKDQHAALLLKVVEGLSTAEVAAVLECSEGAVEQRLVRARATLREWADFRRDPSVDFGAPLVPSGGSR